jgi:hypothetical protein
MSGSLVALIDDNDTDDEPALPTPVRVSLNYFLSAAPLSASASPYPTPIAFVLRPPNLA